MEINSIDNEFKLLNFKQLEIIQSEDNAIAVIAGAGTGKTKTLVSRYLYLINKKNVNPNNILAVTFTKKAACEMLTRIKKYNNSDQCHVMTIHAFCSQVLRKFSNKINVDNNFIICDEIEQYRIFKNIFSQDDLARYNFDKIITYIKHTIAKYIVLTNNKCILYDEVQKIIYQIIDEKFKNLYDNQRSYLKDVAYEGYIQYDNFLKNNKMLDFNDLICEAYKLFMTDQVVLNFYTQQYKYIMIDEFQDTNDIQYDIFFKIIKYGNNNIFVIGDDDQNIYSWRGCNSYYLLNFEKNFKNSRIYVLDQNYRSTQKIINFSNAIISSNNIRTKKKLWTSNTSNNDVQYDMYNNWEEETIQCINKIIELHDKYNYDYCDIAVLFRTMNAKAHFIKKLHNFDIQYNDYKDNNIANNKCVKLILTCLRLYNNVDNNDDLEKILKHMSCGIGEITIQKIKDICQEKNYSMYFVMSNIKQFNIVKKNIQNNIIDFITFINTFLNFDKHKSISELLDFIIKSFDIYKDVGSTDTINNAIIYVNTICNIQSAKKMICESFCTFLDEITCNVDYDVNYNINKDKIHLLTIHQSKGLEFKNVFIPYVHQDMIPHICPTLEINDDLYIYDKIEEERRIFYVGITRAKERLFLSYSECNFYGKKCCESSFLSYNAMQYLKINNHICVNVGMITNNYLTL